MRLLAFDDRRRITAHGGSFSLIPLMGPDDAARAVLLELEPGDVVGEHPAPAAQLLVVVSGSGWVSGDDGVRHAVSAHLGALWGAGERHAAGTDHGMVAVSIEGDFEVAGTPVPID